jgi:hypothetical protein
MNDFSKYKFRCSGLGNLLVDPRSKSDPLSETTKTYLKEIWIWEMFGRKKLIATKYMDKGIAVESDSLELVKTVTGKMYFKNQKQFENDYITGTPDVDGKNEDSFIDVKSSWDIWTFGAVTEDIARKTYYGQLLGYMILLNKQKSSLAYCLVNTPEDIIQYELYKLKASGAIKDIPEDEEKALKNYMFDDIDPAKRIKMYNFGRDAEIEEKLIQRIIEARKYLNNLSL